MQRSYKAEAGGNGTSAKKHGADGRDLVLRVPVGTVLWSEDGERLTDLTEHGARHVLLGGGRGGKGNVHYKSATRQAPRYAQKGESGRSMHVTLELATIADVGLVGLPNAGKSSLLSALTAAHPKVAGYAFTTKHPNLGVIHYIDSQLVVADVPGIIEGASGGAGLGFRFLRHIERTTALLFVVDLSAEGPDDQYRALESEVAAYGRGLSEKERRLVGTKLDLPGSREGRERLKRVAGSIPIYAVSSSTGEGLEELQSSLHELKAVRT
jgi:GTP-binding protein